MAIETKQIQYAKEIDDVMVLVVDLVKDIKAKKDTALLASENLPNLMAALSGVDQVGAEIKADIEVVLSTVGYRIGDLAGAMVK